MLVEHKARAVLDEVTFQRLPVVVEFGRLSLKRQVLFIDLHPTPHVKVLLQFTQSALLSDVDHEDGAIWPMHVYLNQRLRRRVPLLIFV